MNNRNQFTGDPFLKLKRNKLPSDETIIETPVGAFSLSDNDKYMKKDNIIIRFVHVGKRFTGEIQIKIEHQRKDVWYSNIEEIMAENERITMLDYEQREIVEFPISIILEENENYEKIINEFYKIIMFNKPEGLICG